jgi:hypothetical protein
MLYDPNWKPKVQPEIDEVGQIMLKAADYLETHRWGRGNFLLRNGAVCLLGALLKIETGKATGAEDLCPLTNAAAERIRKHVRWPAIPWNDMYSRKKSEVIAALREAAKLK